MASLSFLGAQRQVTGSCYRLEIPGRSVLIDCGQFQERPYVDRNWEPFSFSPAALAAVLLTHAHLDHCGRLPCLVKDGFRGPIVATAPTADLARIVLLDSAHIQEEDAAFKKKRHQKEGRKGPHPEIPLYAVADAEAVFPLFHPAPYETEIPVAPGLSARFHDAGHILGSSMIELGYRTGAGKGETRTIIFSGDIGPWNRPLVRDPSVFGRADVAVMESTYGNREHGDGGPPVDLLARIINETVERGGNIVIPVFAVERAQELLFEIGRLIRDRRIPGLLTVLDSPMAVEVTELFERYRGDLDEEAQALYRVGRSPFQFPGLKLFRTVEESKTVNRIRGSCLILAGSGMATGGRIKHHLMANIERPESTILFVGYQAGHTLGRQIVDGAPEVRINGRMFRVGARVAQIHGFSGHAGQNDLMRWLRNFRIPPRRLFVTHGEAEAAEALAERVRRELGWTVGVPEYGDTVDLD
ncbi:MAG: MBL fold metallo-hydrolase [Candidatus Aminicenantales bacterium]|jgi:metallo-beta-lactamase family protein